MAPDLVGDVRRQVPDQVVEQRQFGRVLGQDVAAHGARGA
jgi:hypothetical protein